jgi:hypothetical protein
MVNNFISALVSGVGCMIESINMGKDGGLGHLSEDSELEPIRVQGRAEPQIDPVDRWWLDA